MTLFYQAAAAVLLASVLGLAVSKQTKEIHAVLIIGVCCMVIMAAISFLEPVLDLLYQLETLGNLDGEMVQILFKIVGIGMISEISALICTDAGNASLGKAMQILATAVILWISIPVFSALLELIQQILGDI